MTVDEGKGFSKMLASRKTFAEHTKLNKRPLYPVILSKNFVPWCLSGDEQKMSNEPNICRI